MVNHQKLAQAALVAGLLLGRGMVAQSQSNADANSPYRGDPKHLVVIALVGDAGFGQALGRITRYKAGNPRNVIEIRKSVATAGVLEYALRQLADSRRMDGYDVPKSFDMWILDGSRATADTTMQRLFTSLLHARSYAVGGVGTVPAIAVPIAGDSVWAGKRVAKAPKVKL